MVHDALFPGHRIGEPYHEYGVEVRNRRTQIRRGDSARGRGGVKRSRDTAVIEADALPLSQQSSRSYAAFPRDNQSWAHQRSR